MSGAVNLTASLLCKCLMQVPRRKHCTKVSAWAVPSYTFFHVHIIRRQDKHFCVSRLPTYPDDKMADARGEYWYYEDGVDANKITVPELRSILLRHGVTYPSSAKKPILVGLFNDVVLPQKSQVQRAYARTKRSTRGIVDVPSSSASTVDTTDVEDETLVAPAPATGRRTLRRTGRATTEEADAPAPRSKTPSRTVPAKHSRAAEPEVDERPAARRTRKSATPAPLPLPKEPSPEPEAWHRNDAASPFTQENPFQSGSSPAIPDTISRERRRRTTGYSQHERRKSDVHRRRTVQPKTEQIDDGIMVPTRGTFDVADPRTKHEEEEDTADAGEEFTPEEQLELVRERAKAGEVDILPPRKRQKKNKATGTIKAMAGTILLTATAAFAGVWRQEKINVGFCGIGREATALAGVEIPSWADQILPQCEPCPPHAQCYRGLNVRCDPDFIKKDHPLSLGGLVPLPPTCEPDSEKTRKVNGIANRAVEVLRQRKAQYECGEPDAEGHPVESPEVSEVDLKEQMAAQKSKSLTDQEFSDLFDRAFPELLMREEVVQTTDDSSSVDTEQPANDVLHQPLSQSSPSPVASEDPSDSLLNDIFSRFNRAMEIRAKQLASDAYDRLQDQAALSYQAPGVEKGISMTQLRDDVLRTEFNASRRQKLWKRVQAKVEKNSNVRAGVRTTANGDVARMWEWVGPVRRLEDGRSSGARDSGRFSLGMGSSPPSASKDVKDVKDVQKWEEGRPVY
ncbi:Man1-Src1p-C-terminal domain-containing protein [Bipolaris maydis]|nr:Man1-Src1p-C-terminal domain-containing protein [Bipolaris maydis]